MVPACNTQDGPTNTADGPASSSMARICGLCEGSGELKYDYNFRAMSKTCEQCDGEGLLNTKKSLEKKDDKHSEQSTRTGGAARVMSHKQRYSAPCLLGPLCDWNLTQSIGWATEKAAVSGTIRVARISSLQTSSATQSTGNNGKACRERVNALKSQISRLEQKIGDLEAEKMQHVSTQADADSEQTVCLLKDLTAALGKSLDTLYRSKRDREDHLSYYDNMEAPPAQAESQT